MAPWNWVRAAVDIGERPARYSLLLENDAERRQNRIAAWFQQALDRGDIEYWSESAVERALAGPAITRDSSPLWLALALAGFVGLMVTERAEALGWLRRRLANNDKGGMRDRQARDG